MLIKTNTKFRIEDFYQSKDQITFITNTTPDFNILKESKTLYNASPLVKTAKVIRIVPKESDFLYVRNRAVSAGNVLDNGSEAAELIDIERFYKNFERYANKCRGSNDNGDFFSHEELIKKYKTFIGKSVFVDHDNENVENARGIIIDAVYNNKGKYVELLKAVDKKAYPELARGIELGYITDTSMGCRCGSSICSICGNIAVSEEDFCEHIKNYKGSTFNGLPVWEDNRDIEFFEDSFVTTGADRDAKILERVASRHHNIINKINNDKFSNSILKNIYNEKNQRTYQGRVKSIFNNLNDLPWS